jgi:hypothetical protein
MLAALNLYAVLEAPRRDKEKARKALFYFFTIGVNPIDHRLMINAKQSADAPEITAFDI